MFKSRYNAKKRRGRGLRRLLFVTAALVVIAGVAMVVVRHVYYQNLQPVNDSQAVKLFTISSGESSNEVANHLKDEGLIRSAQVFDWYISSKGVRSQLQAGTYSLRSSMSVQQIVDVFISGKIAANLVTILPGQRLDQVRDTFVKAGFQTTAVDAALDASQYTSSPVLADKPAKASLEGFLYPDSFQKNQNTQPQLIVRESLNEMARALTPSIRAAFAKQGLSVYQGVTLASIVEQEVSEDGDRAQAAQVFLKRLHSGMSLGSDVTAFYGAHRAGQKPSTTFDSPYNTLLHKGLPPGPISNVSASSLKAVAFPAQTDWLYFVAGDNGKTYFSKTLDQHEAYTQQYCHKLCAGTQ